MGEQLRFGRLTVDLSSTGKVLFPADGITKGEIIDHYRRAAGHMLPHLRGRPIAMARFPDGIDGERIFQKNTPGYFPGWVTTAEVKKHGGTVRHVICDKAATLVYLANQACIEPHGFLSRVDRIEHPDELIFDLDPADESGFGVARTTALELRDLLRDEFGLTGRVKTTGGDGLHVHVPLNRRSGYDDVREFARSVAGVLVDRHPDQLTTQQRKKDRAGRMLVDVMRNAYAQTAVAPYAVRARPGAHVAVPLHWDEVRDSALRPGHFTIRTIGKRLEYGGDPWAGTGRGQDLRKARDRARGLAA